MGGRWRALEQRSRRGGFRERNHVAQASRAREQHHHAVESDREAAVGRRARLEAVEEEPEAGLGVPGREPEQREHLALYRRISDADGPRAELVAIVDRVVMQRAARERLAIELPSR